MNRDQFIDFLEHPERLNGSSLLQLDQVVREFPWFSTAHLLYTKNLHNENSIHYNAHLKIAAAYTTDRKMLYNLIRHKRKAEKHEEKLPEAPKNEQVIVKTLELPVQEERIVTTEEPKIELVELMTEEKNDRISEEQKAEVIETEKPSFEKVKGLDEVEKLEDDKTKLEQEFLSSAISATVEKELDELIEEKQEFDLLKEIHGLKEAKRTFDPKGLHSFTEWLNLASSAVPEADEKKKKMDELINKFIIDEPKISKPKPEFYSPVNMARKSVMDNDEIVSETLAKIYYQQGNLLKALKAYKTLSLKYPEKKQIFAPLIKEIEQKLRHQK